jgi:nitrogen fixation negative regulator NifL
MSTKKSLAMSEIPAAVFRQVVEQADLAVSITDTRANILYVNPAFTRATGYAPADVIGRNQSMLSHKITPSAVYQDLWQTISAGDSWTGRLVNRRADGSKYLAELLISPVLDAEGKVANYLGLHRDVTELHRLESEVRNQKALIESVVDVAPVVLALLDGEDSVVLANQEYRHLMADLGMAEPGTVILEAVRNDLGHGIGVPRAGEEAFAGVEVRIDRPAGRTPRWFSCSGIWVRRDEGDADSFFGHENSIYLLLVAMEITEQRAQQEKARMAALQAMLAESDRVNNLRETLTAAVFQLEGPINVLNSVVGMMGRRGHDPAVGALAEALRAGQNALDTLRSAIPTSTEELPTAVNLNEALRDVLVLATSRLLAAGIRVSWKPQAVLPAINGYPNRLRGMLKALVDNAAEAMNTRGWAERELTLSSRSYDGMVEIVIDDTGPGIPDDLRLKVFEPFFTTKKSSRSHLGTGLSSAQQVAQDHGGAIELDSREGGGCRVRVVLPRKSRTGDGA